MVGASVLEQVCAALALEGAEEALTKGLSILAASGICAEATGQSEPWLVVEAGGRALHLFVATEPVEAPPRGVLGDVLRIALLRAVADEQSRKARERVDMLSAASFEGILVHAEGVVIDVNQRFAEMMGSHPDEIIGQNTTQRFVAPEDLQAVLARMQGGHEGAYVITGVRKGGARFRAELQSKQGRLGDRPVRVVAMRDVTERERTHELLRESEARLRVLAEGVFDGIVFSRDGIVVDVGGPIQARLGLDPEAMKARPILAFVAPSSRAVVARSIEEGRPGSLEIEIVGAGGEPIAVEVIVALSTLGGEPVRIAGLRDLREKRRLESERAKLMQHVERGQRIESLGVLAGGIAHDFNNLLVGVLGNAGYLLERLTDAEERKAASAIRAAGERAAELTAQMLAYAGRRDFARLEPVDLSALFTELSGLLDAILSKKARLDFSFEIESVVLGDRATLTQVLMNLLTNASDALGPSEGVIRVSTRRTHEPDARFRRALGAPVGVGDWVLTEVRDSGAGMDAETMGRIFEPFFSTKETGQGLGLAACLGIVSTHRGAIVVESELGRGTCFSVLLPAAKTATQAVPDQPAVAPAQPIRVLVVDDESMVRSLLRRLLERRGFTVEEACDGRSALALLERTPVDLIVLDMTMPDLDGAEVVRRVRESGSKVPILLSSGYMEAKAEKALEQSMIQGFLSKPFSPTTLMEAVNRALATRCSGH
jgi:two-component system cell cycle sensor histidine kinase/response regulator CckA